jgi:hypothetical protein
LGRYKVFPVAGTVVMTIGLFLLSRLDADTSRGVQALYMAVVGLGIGLVMQVLVLAVQNAVEFRDLGTATSANTFFRSMGGAFGVAVYGAIFASGLDRHLARLLPAGAGPIDATVIRSGPERLAALPGPVHGAVVEAFARSLHTVFLWAMPVAAAGFVVVLFLKELPLRTSVHVGMETAGPVEM